MSKRIYDKYELAMHVKRYLDDMAVSDYSETTDVKNAEKLLGIAVASLLGTVDYNVVKEFIKLYDDRIGENITLIE